MSESLPSVVFIDPRRPLVVTTEQMREAVHKSVQTEVHGLTRYEIYFPSRMNISSAVEPKDLTTPWESPLEGLRLADFRGTGLRFLIRQNGQVTWSRPLAPTDFTSLLDQFTERIAVNLTSVMNLVGAPIGTAFAYSVSTIGDLLRKSFVDAIKPPLIPLLQWPARDVCIAAVQDAIGTGDWRTQDYGGTRELKKMSDKFVFEVRGERGAVEVQFESTNRDEVLWAIFETLINVRYWNDRGNLVFDSIA